MGLGSILLWRTRRSLFKKPPFLGPFSGHAMDFWDFFGPKKGHNSLKNGQNFMPEVLKMIWGHQGTYTNTFGGVLNTFGIFDFFHLYQFFPLHPLFGPFWPFLVPRTERLVRHRATFSLGPITFDRLFKKKIPRVPAESWIAPAHFKLYFDLF